MKFATWNVNSLSVRLPQVLAWLEQTATDILAIQETKLTDDKFPVEPFQNAGYQAAYFGQKTYNGVAIISRHTLSNVTHNIAGFEDPQARVISATINTDTIHNVRIINAYIPNGQAPESEKFQYKMQWLTALQNWIATELQTHPKLLLAGDFNIAPTDQDVYDPLAWKNQILCTPQERAHFQQLLQLGLTDAFRMFEQPEKSWSWWDYRNLAFRKNQGLRIDHILLSHQLKEQASSCTIDKTPRKNERPSDHTPVILELKTRSA